MYFKGIELVCPRCKGELAYDLVLPDRLCCSECASSYPIILGIPDLRVFPDPYIDPAADIAKGEQLASHFQEFDFPGLVHYYYLNTQVVPAQHAELYTRSVLTGEARSQTSFRIWEGDQPQQETRLLRLVEIGCGTGPLLRVAAAHYALVVGVDIAFRWLIVAKKRLQEAGLDIPLICACAEALPFPDDTFDRMAAESTIEHVKNQPATISEAWRVLSPGAQLWIAAPNRLSLGPDPQLGILAGGYLPASWIGRICAPERGNPSQTPTAQRGRIGFAFTG